MTMQIGIVATPLISLNYHTKIIAIKADTNQIYHQ